MADFNSTNRTTTFEEWHEQLVDYAELRDVNAPVADLWVNA